MGFLHDAADKVRHGLFGDSAEEKEQKQRNQEVHSAAKAQTQDLAQGGVGLSHDKIALYDRRAHNLSARLAKMPYERAVEAAQHEWYNLFAQYTEEGVSTAALAELTKIVEQGLAQSAQQTTDPKDVLKAELQEGNKAQAKALKDGGVGFNLIHWQMKAHAVAAACREMDSYKEAEAYATRHWFDPISKEADQGAASEGLAGLTQIVLDALTEAGSHEGPHKADKGSKGHGKKHKGHHDALAQGNHSHKHPSDPYAS